MACNKPFKTAEANAKAWLRDKEVIDDYLNITDYPNFKRRNHELTLWGRSEYGIDAQWFFEENNKAIPNKKEFQKVDRKNGVTYKDMYYQLSNKNSKVNKRLNNIIIKYAKMMGIKIMSIEQYRKDYAHRNLSEEIMPIALADLMEGVIAYNQDKLDLTTLPEELAHFIVAAMWGDPLMDIIRGRDKEGNVINPYLRSSKYWTNNYNDYIEKYEGDEEMVEKEIVGKILADRIISEEKNVRRENMPSFIRRLYELFDRLLKKLFSNFDPDLTLETLPQEVEIAAGKVARQLLSNEVKIKKEDVLITDIQSHKQIESLLKKASRDLRNERRNIQKTQTGLYNRALKEKYKELTDKYGKDTVENLRERIEKSEDPVEREEIGKLLELELSVLQDRKTASRIKTLNQRYREINDAIRQKNYETGLYEFVLGSGGMKEIINEAMDRFFNNRESLDIGEVGELNNILKIYKPHLDTIKFMFENKVDMGNNTKLLKEINKELSGLEKQIRILSREYTKIMDEAFAATAEGINAQAGEDFYSLDPSTYTDIGHFSLFLGDIANVANPIAKRFIQIIYEIKAKVQKNTVDFAVDFYKEYTEAIRQMPSYGFRNKGRALIELDENGDATGYWFGKFRLGGKKGFFAAKNKFGEEVVERILQFAKEQGITVPTHPDPNVQSNLIKSWMFGSDMYKNKEEQTAVMQRFKEEWALWHLENTNRRPDYKKIMELRKSQMNETQYAIWEENNIRTITVKTKTDNYKYVIYSGELSIPSNGAKKEILWKGKRRIIQTVDWRNPEFETRIKDPNFKKALLMSRNAVMEAKGKLGKANTLQETMMMPQISRDFLDVITGTDVFKGLGELLGDQFLRREDDTIRPELEDNKIVKKPITRFTSPLENPASISDDIVKIVVAFEHMKNEHVENAKRLPELTDLLALSGNQKFRRNLLSGLVGGQDKDEVLTERITKNLLEEKIEHFLNTHIYGSVYRDIWDDAKISPAKISNNMSKYVRNLLLLGNYVAALTGLGMASIQNFIEAMIGEYTTVADYGVAKREYIMKIAKIVNDYKSGVKTNKITAAFQEIGILDSIPDSFSNLNRWKINRASLALPNYGFWRAMDHMSKTQGMIAIANNIRLVEGEWKQGKNHQWDLTNDKTWKKAPTLWDHISFNNGKLVYSSDVTDKAIQLWKDRSLMLAQRLDQKPDAIHHGTLKNHILGGFLTMFMSWMYQGIEMRFKKKQFDAHLDNVEEGYYRSLGRFVSENFRDSIVQVLTELAFGAKMGSKVTGSDPIMDYAQINARKRVLADLIAMTSVVILATTLLQAAWDDDDDNYALSMSAYISSRLVLERSAFLTPKEFLNYVDNPIAGIEYIEGMTNTFGIFGEFFRFVIGQEDDDIVRSGIYKGYTQRQKKIMKSIPLFRGFYENLGAGTINEYLKDQGRLRKATETTGTAPKMKARYITSHVINKGDITSPLQFPYMAALCQIMGIEIADLYSEIQKGDLGDLPVKSN